jgi:hypothetical protein
MSAAAAARLTVAAIARTAKHFSLFMCITPVQLIDGVKSPPA